MASGRSITVWSVLALVAAVAGTAGTIAADQRWMKAWGRSGLKFPISQRAVVDLPAGPSLVYYESAGELPPRNVDLHLLDSAGLSVDTSRVTEDISYRLLRGGRSARAMWKLDMPEAGPYKFYCYNNNYEDESEVPADDRVVFLKQPDTLAEATAKRRMIQLGGATITIAGVVVLYLLHAAALRK